MGIRLAIVLMSSLLLSTIVDAQMSPTQNVYLKLNLDKHTEPWAGCKVYMLRINSVVKYKDKTSLQCLNWVPTARLIYSNKQFAPYAQIGLGLEYKQNEEHSQSLNTAQPATGRLYGSNFGIGVIITESIDIRATVYHYSNTGSRDLYGGANNLAVVIGYKF